MLVGCNLKQELAGAEPEEVADAVATESGAAATEHSVVARSDVQEEGGLTPRPRAHLWVDDPGPAPPLRTKTSSREDFVWAVDASQAQRKLGGEVGIFKRVAMSASRGGVAVQGQSSAVGRGLSALASGAQWSVSEADMAAAYETKVCVGSLWCCVAPTEHAGARGGPIFPEENEPSRSSAGTHGQARFTSGISVGR